ncbi:YrhK family protein [Maritimibacter sp. DP1N21-5]|uniref:YrhK family protein n=1 Tax=Maritimibacter sp. DP1N21-5 TaxID=2836867 RepID=UPI001C43A278|nr:YrhK family protein [Maritimibacter sp. DP1N21-5]MBV7408363.1 YrhK family protein [Maritimibacter sp. DP1N21-5]
MPLFHPDNRTRSEASRKLYARYEVAHTGVDFLAAACFLIGSFLFFSNTTQYAATWLFVIGSLAFAAKPTIRLIREVKLYRLGDLETLAERDT